MGRVTVVGSINQDVVVTVPHLPAPGETVLGHGHSLVPGGKGANQAVGGAGGAPPPATLVGRVGHDPAGESLRTALTAAGVDVEGVGVDKRESTGRAFVLVDDRGENAIALSPGANRSLLPDHLPESLAAADVVCLQLEVPLVTVAAAVAAARCSVLNAAPATPLPHDLLDAVDVLIVNETEAAALSGGLPVATPLEALDAADAISGPAAVVVTLGPLGAVVCTGDRRRHLPAPRVTAVDTTAAGDAFCGAVAARLADGAGLEAAVEWGVAAGAAAVTRAGAQPSLPSPDEVAALL